MTCLRAIADRSRTDAGRHNCFLCFAEQIGSVSSGGTRSPNTAGWEHAGGQLGLIGFNVEMKAGPDLSAVATLGPGNTTIIGLLVLKCVGRDAEHLPLQSH